MKDWMIKEIDNWICFYCHENKAVEWWAKQGRGIQFSICADCKSHFIRSINIKKEKSK